MSDNTIRDIEWPTSRAFFSAMDSMTCPWCGAGPFKSPAGHTQRMHGASAAAMRDYYGLEHRDGRAYAFAERYECCWNIGCEDAGHCEYEGRHKSTCPRGVRTTMAKATDRSEYDAWLRSRAEREDAERLREAERQAMWRGFLLLGNLMTPLQLTLENTTLLEAMQWRDEHRDAWDAVVQWAHVDAKKRGYCSMQTYMEALRSPALAGLLGIQRQDDEPYRLNHNLRSGLTRLILDEYPLLPFRTRRSKCDPTEPTA